ncbi:hypothetical protein E2562_002029 [Oryza meyeriana var. granulata]|uniref:Uncharacterized protein n=1 Tax=Oryza meyeriana var. granulata TaxID=110450 RepID=A0A6G1C5B4_9ORYZ|nr:hypothetical protein E2562_002029 [Oryza meyeriana var. granulata]
MAVDDCDGTATQQPTMADEQVHWAETEKGHGTIGDAHLGAAKDADDRSRVAAWAPSVGTARQHTERRLRRQGDSARDGAARGEQGGGVASWATTCTGQR